MEKERKSHPSLYWQRQGISEVPQRSAAVLAAHLYTKGEGLLKLCYNIRHVYIMFAFNDSKQNSVRFNEA